MEYTIERLSPFGAVIKSNNTVSSIEQFSPQQIFDWLNEYKLIVFRGYEVMPKQRLALFAQKLGKPLQWVFGAINDLKVKPDTENYIFTDHDVPMHWDGAFVGTIPHVILFQCIVAPKLEDMGGTTFADTQKILENSPPEKINEWKDIEITYRTKKIVHYGGKIRQKFISRHEVEDKQVIRYAEPVEDLNPVSLEIKGLKDKTPEVFTAEIKELLYKKDYLYTHRWQAGDIVLADNHTLLHGREAFKNPNERYIQRVNILHRPPGFSLVRFLNNSLIIRRKEFFVAELPIFLIPLFLCISSWNDLLQPSLYAGLLAIILMFNAGDMINCYADYALDSIYKSHLSNAVYELGKKNVKWQIILSTLLSFILTIGVALYTQQFYLIPLTVFGIFIGLQYSVKPFKFKSRGILQLFCLWGIIFFGPMLYTAIITNGFPCIAALFLFAFYGFHQMGIILLNTAEDYTEDKADHLNTIVVALGFHRTMNFAYRLVILSGLAIQAILALLFFNQQLPGYFYIFIGVFTAGWLKIVFEYKRIIDKINTQQEEDAIKEIKKNGMKVPQWLKTGAYTCLAVVTAYLVYNLYH